MDECAELARAILENTGPLHLPTFTEALAVARTRLPSENPAGQIVNNVAWYLFKYGSQQS